MSPLRGSIGLLGNPVVDVSQDRVAVSVGRPSTSSSSSGTATSSTEDSVMVDGRKWNSRTAAVLTIVADQLQSNVSYRVT